MFSIGSSSDSKWVLNENSDKLIGLNFNRISRISSWNFQFGVKLGQETYNCT
jgi:hypothetical protein